MKKSTSHTRYARYARQCLILLITLCIALLPGALASPRAHAAPAGSLATAPPHAKLSIPGFPGYTMGVIGVMSSGQNVYCHEWGVQEEWNFSATTPIPDSATTRAAAYLLRTYQNSTDPLTHAALALLVHDHFELTSSRPTWDKDRPKVLANLPGLEDRARALWDEGVAHTVNGTHVTMEYLQGRRRGSISVSVENQRGERIGNIPVRVQLHGPAQFDSTGTQSVDITSGAEPIEMRWTATGQGEVSTSQSVTISTLDDLESAQNFVRLGQDMQKNFDGIRFDVRKVFQPTIATAVPDLTNEAGRNQSDTVRVGVKEGDVWEEGVELAATGYLYTGLTHERIAQLHADADIRVQPSDSARDYLARLERKGLKAQGIARGDFSHDGQSIDFIAADASKSALPYMLGEEDKFASWVWVISREEQGEESKEWIEGDAISGLLDVKESFSTRTHVTVDSTVTEHSATQGATLTDRITIAGFPDDHGSYLGDTHFGWKADEKYATVSVYWSLHKPDSAEVPQNDEEHQLMGSWQYLAKNGVIAVGGGKPDAFGTPVHITAERLGYYAFVYSFAGDDRVMPVQSDWNDEWECTRVVAEPKSASISTHVSTAEVQPGEEFADIARVSGDIPEGSYVTFTAYDAVEDTAELGTSATLMHEETVLLDPSMRNEDGSYTVTSPYTHTTTGGTVYWKATLWNEAQEILASHGLGVPGEDTYVVPPDEPEDTPEEPEPAPAPREPLAQTGVAIGAISSVSLATLLVGAMISARALKRTRTRSHTRRKAHRRATAEDK